MTIVTFDLSSGLDPSAWAVCLVLLRRVPYHTVNTAVSKMIAESPGCSPAYAVFVLGSDRYPPMGVSSSCCRCSFSHLSSSSSPPPPPTPFTLFLFFCPVAPSLLFFFILSCYPPSPILRSFGFISLSVDSQSLPPSSCLHRPVQLFSF